MCEYTEIILPSEQMVWQEKNIQCSDSIQFHFIVKCMHISTERQSTKLIVHEMVSLGQKTQPILYSSHIPCNYNTIRLCDEWSDE